VLRQGTVPDALLHGSAAPALRLKEVFTSACSGGDVALTHAELRQRAERVAAGLARLGLAVGARVSLYAASSLHWILAYLGAQRAGATVNPFNPAYREAEVEHILVDCAPSMVLVDRARRALVEDLRSSVPALARVQVVDVEDLPEGPAAPLLPARGP